MRLPPFPIVYLATVAMIRCLWANGIISCPGSACRGYPIRPVRVLGGNAGTWRAGDKETHVPVLPVSCVNLRELVSMRMGSERYLQGRACNPWFVSRHDRAVAGMKGGFA